MLQEVEPLMLVVSKSKIPFKVLLIGRHAQDCSEPMVVYTNLEATKDAKKGTIWVLCESIFLKTFTQK